jgi:3-oxoacyl-[acyl-carrier protein] reductase
MAKTAIVTGASRGIGREIVKRLATDGFSVVVNYSANADQADEAVSKIQAAGGKAIAVKANVSKENEVEQLFEHTITTLGSIDVVVHSAGIMSSSPIIDNDV